jgi:hypothetical protein
VARTARDLLSLIEFIIAVCNEALPRHRDTLLSRDITVSTFGASELARFRTRRDSRAIGVSWKNNRVSPALSASFIRRFDPKWSELDPGNRNWVDLVARRARKFPVTINARSFVLITRRFNSPYFPAAVEI